MSSIHRLLVKNKNCKLSIHVFFGNRYQEEAAAKEVMLQREKQEHKATQEELIDSQAKNKKLTREVDDANDTADRLQRNINRFDVNSSIMV